MFRSFFILFILFSTTHILAGNNQLQEYLSNTITNSIISDANLYQSDIQVYNKKDLDLTIDSTNTLLNSRVENGSKIYQNTILIDNISITNIVINSQNIIENSTFNNATVIQGRIVISQ